MAQIVITPPRRFSLPSVSELWEAREVLYRFGLRDVVLRYRQTVVGVAWVILQPLLAAGIFTVVFSLIADIQTGTKVPYFLFSYMSMLAWNVFANIVTRAAPSLVSNQALVSKVFFPRMLVPLSTGLSVLMDFLVALALGVVLLFVAHISPGWGVLLLPVWLVLLFMFASGIGLAASALMVKYRDVQYVLPWVVQMGMYASPVAYPPNAIPGGLQWLIDINPVTWYLAEFRYSLLGSSLPPLWQILASVAAAVIVFVGASIIFQRFEREFADFI